MTDRLFHITIMVNNRNSLLLFMPKSKNMRKLMTTMMLLLSINAFADNLKYVEQYDIPYKKSQDAYTAERCKLDIHYPEDTTGCPVVVWFHGGGLTQGSKSFPWKLKEKGMVLVAVGYRLLPKVEISECLDDAAAAIAWVFREIEKYGGDKRKIFISGHSAGGYLTAMTGLDKQWLARYDTDADEIAGLIPFSGQMISHFSYREMKGIGNLQPVIDEYAPLFHVRKDAPPLILITGDRNIELFGRYEENAYMWRMMKLTGHTDTYLYEIDGHGHGSMAEPAYHILENHVKKITGMPVDNH